MSITRTTFATIVTCITVSLFGCGGSETEFDGGNDADTLPTQETPDVTQEPASELYRLQCSSCHGALGQGGAGGGELYHCESCNSEQALYDSILVTMPIGASQMCGNTCAQKLAAYIYSDFDPSIGAITDPPGTVIITDPTPVPEPAPDANPDVIPPLDLTAMCEMPKPTSLSSGYFAAGSSNSCASCHGDDGVSGIFIAPDLTTLDYLDNSAYTMFATTVRTGNGSMPAFKDSEGNYPHAFLLNDFAFFSYDMLCQGDPPVVTPSPEATPVPTPVPNLPIGPNGYVFCSGESSSPWGGETIICEFSGTLNVAFGSGGANGTYAYESFTDGVDCSIDSFGDPTPGAAKYCFISAGTAPTPTPQPTQAPNPNELSCEAQGELFTPQIRRLTQTQFINTVKDVFGGNFSDAIWPELGDGIPTLGMSNRSNTLSINSVNIEPLYDSIANIVDSVLQNNTVVSDCANSDDSACLINLLDTFGPQLWRRPLLSTERETLLGATNSIRNQGANNSDQIRFVLKSMMLSSNFMFRSELGAAQDNVTALNNYEIASLMAYTLWDSPPDATLYDLAKSGQLSDPGVIDQQVARMLSHRRFTLAMATFYGDFLKLERVKTVEKIPSLNFSTAIRDALLQSTQLTLESRLQDIDQDVLDVLNSNEFYVNTNIAYLFGLDSEDYSQNFTPVQISSPERNGFFTHPAFLAVHSKEGGSGIVKRGVFVLQQMMCLDLGEPPNEFPEADLPPNVDPETTSTRDLLFMRHTSQPVCSGCHQIIDPAGYGFENYDAVGQFRMFEKGTVPIDSSGVLDFISDQPIAFNNHLEYTSYLMNSPEVRACVSRRFLENFIGQNIESNSCEHDKLTQLLDDNTVTIRNLVTNLMRLESLRLRQQ